MLDDEKRATGTHHHTEDKLENPVQYSKYYWLKVYLFLCGTALLIYCLIVSLFN